MMSTGYPGGGKCDKPRDAKLSGNVSVQEAPFDMVWQLSTNDKAHVSLKKIAFFYLHHITHLLGRGGGARWDRRAMKTDQ